MFRTACQQWGYAIDSTWCVGKWKHEALPNDALLLPILMFQQALSTLSVGNGIKLRCAEMSGDQVPEPLGAQSPMLHGTRHTMLIVSVPPEQQLAAEY